MSGKTRLVMHLLDKITMLHPVPKTIVFYYDQFQEQYNQLKHKLASQGVTMTLHQGSNLTINDLEKKDHQTLVIIDDATEETASSHDIAKITTNGRHKNTSLWLIWHSLYSKHPASRLITQNVSYIFFLPSVRLISQVHSLDTQLRMKGNLVAAFKQATESSQDSYRYLLLDLAPLTPDKFRLRSQVTNDAQVVYLPRSSKK